MSLTTDGGNGMVMPVSPMYGGGYGGGFGGGWGDGWWVILFLFALMGNWGGGFGGGMGGGGEMFPYFFNTQTQNDVNRGFDNAGITSQLSGIHTAVTSGFANAEVAGCNRAMDAMQTAYDNQIASMNQNFANQQALDSRLNSMQMAQQECCCENRAGIADLKYTIATENCADRYEAASNTRDIIENANRNNQAILDKLCALELDAKNDKIADLERQLTMANLSASQIAQTAQIQRGQTAEVDALYQRLKDCPVPTMPVYGSQPIFTCGNNTGCGCGFGGFNGNF